MTITSARLPPPSRVALALAPLGAQWPAHPNRGVPLKADGTPNLEAPAPRTADGKPDLTGVWLNEWFYGGQVRQPPAALPGEPPPSTFGEHRRQLPQRPAAAAVGEAADGRAQGRRAARTTRTRTACRWG